MVNEAYCDLRVCVHTEIKPTGTISRLWNLEFSSKNLNQTVLEVKDSYHQYLLCETHSRTPNRKMPRFVGWGATHVGGFPDLSEVAFEARNPTQRLPVFASILIISTQPNLILLVELL